MIFTLSLFFLQFFIFEKNMLFYLYFILFYTLQEGSILGSN